MLLFRIVRATVFQAFIVAIGERAFHIFGLDHLNACDFGNVIDGDEHRRETRALAAAWSADIGKRT